MLASSALHAAWQRNPCQFGNNLRRALQKDRHAPRVSVHGTVSLSVVVTSKSTSASGTDPGKYSATASGRQEIRPHELSQRVLIASRRFPAETSLRLCQAT